MNVPRARPRSLLQTQQGTDYDLVPSGFEKVTSPLHPGKTIAESMRHFDPDVYDTTPESHLTRLMSALLGDSGVGLLRKRTTVARLQASLAGTHFLDLDRFWGAVFGIRRRADEILPFDPYLDEATDEEWAEAHIRDASYRSRIMKFARAIHLAGTKDGIEAMSEAILGVDVDVIENGVRREEWRRTWGDVEAMGTWGDVEAKGTWDDVEWRRASVSETGGTTNFNTVTVHPLGPVSWEAIADLDRALLRIKPAGVSVRVVPTFETSFTTVPIAAAAADSENWAIVAVDRPAGSNVVSPRKRVAWAARQAEVWSHNEAGLIAVAYVRADEVSDDARYDPDIEQAQPQVITVDGVSSLSYPSDAIMPPEQILAGRSVSSGIAVGSPFDPARYNDAAAGTDDVVIDGQKVSTITPSGLPATPSYWVSSVRPFDSDAREVLEFRMDRPMPVNRVSLKISRYPLVARVQWWDASTNRWVTIDTIDNSASKPLRVDNALSGTSMHSYPGHWMRFKRTLPEAVVTSALRIVIRRKKNAPGPILTRTGKRAPYSVAVKGFSAGYQITSTDTIPNGNPDEPIITVTNSAGATSQYFIRRERADLVLDDAPTAWRCEPQPISQAVVSMYLDVRDGEGNAQGIDRVILDPVSVGPTFNVYTTSQDPAGLSEAESPDDAIVPSEIVGSIFNDSSGLIWPSTKAWVEFSNTRLRFDPRAAWWCVTTLTAGWSSNESPARTATLFSAGPNAETGSTDMSLVWRNNLMEFRVGREVSRLSLDVVAGQQFSVMTSYSPVSGPAIYAKIAGEIITGSTQMSATVAGVPDSVTGAVASLTDSANITADGLVVTNDGGTPWDSAIVPGVTFPTVTTSIEIDVDLTEWQTGASRTVWSIGGGSGQNVAKIDINSTGHVVLSLSADGTAWTSVTSDSVPAKSDGDLGRLTVTWDPATGDTNFSIDDDSISATKTLAVTPLTSAQSMVIGGLTGSPSTTVSGVFKRVVVRDVATGSPLHDINFVVPSRLPEVLRIGSSINRADITLRAFALGWGERDYAKVLANPHTFSRRPPVGRGNTDGTILRYHPDYANRRSPVDGLSYGWMGGPPMVYEELAWSPVLASVPLQRGGVEFNPTSAKFVKIEFSNLVPEPYETLIPTTRPVRIFPSTMTGQTDGDRSISSLDAKTQSVTSASMFADSKPLTIVPDDVPVGTAALVPTDPGALDRVSRVGWAFQGQAWQPSSSMPIFPVASTHAYTTLNMVHGRRVAFFVALRSVRIGRFRPTTKSNTRVYYESFHSTDGLGSTTFTLEDGALVTPSSEADGPLSIPAVATSDTLSSRSQVHAVQFATTQTPPFSLVVDDEFRDPALPYSDFSSSGGWTPTGDAALTWDAAVGRLRVVRDASGVTLSASPDTPMVHPPVSPVLSSPDAASWSYADGVKGGIISPSFVPSAKGVLYAGTRLTVESNLDEPLFLRLYGSDDTTILAETEFSPHPWVETEIYIAHPLGGDALLESSMRVAVEQDGGRKGSWTMSALSAFDEAILWEFSNDGGSTWIPALLGRNDPNGLISFPKGGTSLRWRVTGYRHNITIGSIQIRPWYSKRIGTR